RYRRPWNWHDDLLADAEARLARWRRAGLGDAALDATRAALDDDLDTPTALAAIDAAAEAGRGGSSAAELLGVEL
ncbi:MAG TPA: cysteine--tRNA ligase, partial [Acidimicrobiaceae bacterium]|nr:cysteine--tRNA ligase [Acidimicrobiaceae bacterium]